ncbi:MAG: NAD-dependent epimerase/dehydratase family protein [Gaiellaceae bacterium]
MRALVTGGAGFIGSHLVEALLERGDEVDVVDNLATGRRENVAAGARLHELDIREPLDALFAEVRPELCFHLAAQADVGTSVERPDFDAEVNVVGIVRVLEAARKVGASLVFTSTGGAMYGECERPAREQDERRPLSPYGTSKLAGEEYLATWNRLHGMRNVVCRLANVYGPRQLPKLEGGVVAIFLDHMRDGAPTRIFGDGAQTRDFVFVGDVARALIAASAGEPSVYNVGTGIETSVLELHRLCAKAAAVPAEPVLDDARPGDLLRSVLDVGKAERELGWRPQVPLAEGLALTWASVRG